MLFGLSSSGGISTVLATDTLGATQIGFYRRHVNGGAQDANWLIATRDGATQATIDTGLAFVTNEWLRFQLSIRPGGTTVYWRITRLSANLITEGAWTPSGAGLPTAGVVMGLIAALYGIDVANRNIDVLRATLTA